MSSQDLISRHLLRRSWLSRALIPLSQINAFYQRIRRKKAAQSAWRAPCKVISIGNITSGGSGKTPFCIYLAQMLQTKGITVAVSHRGYKGAFESTPTLISKGAGSLYDVSDTGDEAGLIAKRLSGIPVVVGKDRRAALTLLLSLFPATDVVILDDGFQHQKVARDMDFVCFDSQTGLGNGLLLPAGYLREPLDAIAPDDVLIVNNKGQRTPSPAFLAQLKKQSEQLFHCQMALSAYVDTAGATMAAEDLARERCVLVSGIANPASFSEAVAASGIKVRKHLVYVDHYHYSDPKVMDRIATLCGKLGATRLICTEKDLMKLNHYSHLLPPLVALRIDTACTEQEQLLSLTLNRLNLAHISG